MTTTQRTTRLLLAAGLVAPLFVVVMLVLGTVQPGYNEPTLSGQIHGYAPFAVFLSLTALAFVLARRFAADPATRGWRWLSIATGAAVFATFMATAASYDFATQTGHYHGLWQRAGLVIGFGWLAAVAVRQLREHPAPVLVPAAI